MTKKETSRAKILSFLNDLMEADKEEIAYAEWYIKEYSNSEYGGYEYPIEHHFKPTVKYGVYHQVDDLRKAIIDAMGIAPVRIEQYTYIHTYSSHSWSRKKKVTENIPIYSDEAENIVKVVINRMAEQGYIRISKSKLGFKVLKVD